MSPRFVLGQENVPCVAEVVNRSLKADCTDFTKFMQLIYRSGERHKVSELCLKSCADNRSIFYKAPFKIRYYKKFFNHNV